MDESQRTFIEGLEREERALLLRLTAIRQTLEVYRSHSEPVPVAESPIPPGAPSLDGLRIRDAITVYLEFCRDEGRDQITLGELAKALLSFQVTTFRGTLLNSDLIKHKWKTICNSLGSPENKDTWEIQKHSDHYQRADLIGLKVQKGAKHAKR
jgi:hypothetical protein